MAIVLHTTPGSWGLPSISPSCLAAVIFLQLAIPGQFSVSECTNPDASPTGQLPYLTHNHHVVVLLSSIIKYVSSLEERKPSEYVNTNPDRGLSKLQQSQTTAWSAHAEAHLGDLVYYMLYSVPSNWAGMTYQALSSMFPYPQRYFVPARIREVYKPRLEAAGLWHIPEFEKETKKPFQQVSREAEKAENANVFLQAFDREKAVGKAKSTLDIYSRLLKETYFSGHDRPSALDAIVGAHVLLLLEPPYPMPVIKHLVEAYPSLVAHARLLFSQTLSASAPAISKAPSQVITWRDILPSMPWSGKGPMKTEDEFRYSKLRWSFFGLVAGCMATYIAIVGRGVKIRIVRAEDVGGEEEGIEEEMDEDYEEGEEEEEEEESM